MGAGVEEKAAAFIEGAGAGGQEPCAEAAIANCPIGGGG